MKEFNKFDEDQMELLTPLCDHGIRLCYPFFANTFPIGYHYAAALKKRGFSVDEFVKNVRWDQEVKKFIGSGAPTVFYATDDQLDEISDSTEILRRLVTKYHPRYCFVTKTAATIFNQNDPKPLDLDDETVRFLFDDYHAQILSDTPKQAEYLEKVLKSLSGRSNISIEIARSNSISSILAGEETKGMHIYFYSAPTAQRFLRDERFVPIRINEGLLAEDYNKHFQTNICIERSGLDSKLTADLLDDLDKYHQNLFQTAFEYPEHLSRIVQMYNRLDWRINGIAPAFPDSKAYGTCLYEHDIGSPRHLVNAELSDFVEPAVSPKGIHLHFGIGNIGVGLLFPAIQNHKHVIALGHVSDRWDEIVDFQKNVKLRDDHGFQRNSVFIRVKDYLDHNSPAELAQLVSEPGWYCLLIDIEDLKEELKKVLGSAESISTALGDEEKMQYAVDFIDQIDPDPGINVFAFENSIPKNLVETSKRFPLVNLMIDRICSNRTINPTEIRSLSERFGEIVFSPTTSVDGVNTNQEFVEFVERSRLISGIEVRTPKTKEEFDFYKDRKYGLFNQTHFILSAYVYMYIYEQGVNPGELESQFLNLFVEPVLRRSEWRIVVEAVNDLQICKLMIQNSPDVLMRVLGTSDQETQFRRLREYRDSAVDRIKATSGDEVGRILSLEKLRDKPEKYRNHVLELQRFVSSSRNQQRIRELNIFERPHMGAFRRATEALIEQMNNAILTLAEIGKQNPSK